MEHDATTMQPALLEDLDEAVVLRFPPDDPASLLRAALVSKRLCRLVASHAFRRRFVELHRALPMLGFLCSLPRSEDGGRPCSARLVPMSSCLPARAGADDHIAGWQALNARHGRVLLYCFCYFAALCFAVWSPVTGEKLELPAVVPDGRRFPWPESFNATVVCAGGATCDHLDCYHHGPFLVVLVFTCEDGRLFTSLYSSNIGLWSDPVIAYQPPDLVDLVCRVPAALLGNTLYFVFMHVTKTILKYDLGTGETSVIELPPTIYQPIILVTSDSEQGKLAFARVDDFKLCLWSMEVDRPGDAVWTQDRAIELQDLLPGDALPTSPEQSTATFPSLHE